MSADLGLRKFLRIDSLHPSRTSVGAASNYRREADDRTGLRKDDMGFRLTYKHALGAD